ncbi:SDR family NAD(P)-dependent oxidoreductase [Geomonas anaerohicana]|uniref:SDR family oxidoreductase n=1 Tax=Geomonas anaerohicana TaxID=2798583 RepID=A0ABS0Y8Z2_9BACT|nr:SDR family oxidoreductase [Geomonas anaerohicana]MBJ6748771.1 SDR family oxidoreductase [Geomonas anaerohicana]
MKSEDRRNALALAMLGAGAAFFLWSMRRNARRIDFLGKTVVIAGGSRGLGLEIGRQLVKEGARLVLLARRPDELERARAELARSGGDVITFPCDVGVRQQVEEAVAAVIELRGRIDILINVAGVIQVAPFENLELKDFQESMDVHAWGPYHMIRAVAPHMQRRKSGRIVNVSSIGGLVAVPHLLAYTMGKFALTGLSDGFRAELAKDGIYVTTVAPGLMRTGSHINANFKGQHKKEFAWFAISGANPALSTAAPAAAHKIIEACRYGQARLIINWPARLLHAANALFPEVTSFAAGVAARMLPAPAAAADNEQHPGWDSRSKLAPSLLTRPSDRAIEANNEQPADSPYMASVHRRRQ